MKLLYIAAKGELINTLSFNLKPLGFTLTFESDPVKALQSLDSDTPDAILFDAGDFPRHWKPLLRLAREQKNREELIFLLVTPEGFSAEDGAKAAHLGVNGLLSKRLGEKSELYRLEEIIRRYRPVSDKRNFTRLVPDPSEPVGFAFTHPTRLSLVTGRIREISIQGASFLPTNPESAEGLGAGTEIRNCSLKIADRILSVSCKLTRNRAEMGFQFLEFEAGGHQTLLEYIQARGERALKTAAGRSPLPVP